MALKQKQDLESKLGLLKPVKVQTKKTQAEVVRLTTGVAKTGNKMMKSLLEKGSVPKNSELRAIFGWNYESSKTRKNFTTIKNEICL